MGAGAGRAWATVGHVISGDQNPRGCCSAERRLWNLGSDGTAPWTRGLEAPFFLERIAVSAPDPFAYSSICEALDKKSQFCDLHHSRARGTLILQYRLEELTLRGDYHPPSGKSEARAEAAKWLCLV